MLPHSLGVAFCLSLSLVGPAFAQEPPAESTVEKFQPLDVFGLEYASDPRIAPDGRRVVYARRFMDIMADRRRSNLWLVVLDDRGAPVAHKPLTTGLRSDGSHRWSPDGSRLAYVSSAEGSAEIYVRWMDDGGTTARLTQLESSPSGLAWSPDGEWIAFSMFVAGTGRKIAELPKAPRGAEWAPPPKVIDRVSWRSDGAGILRAGFSQMFVVPATGGTPRQLTSGDFHHRGTPSWTPDGKSLVFSANRREDWEWEARDSDVWQLDVATGAMTQLTERYGPDSNPVVSPDGKWIAYTGYEDRHQGHQGTRLWLLDRADGSVRELGASLDRSVGGVRWSPDSRAVWFQYDDRGQTRVARVGLEAGDAVEVVVDGGVGGNSLGRPYTSGSFSVAGSGRFAYTTSSPSRPADVGIGRVGAETRTVTELNEDVLGHRTLAPVEEFWVESSHDGRPVQCWLALPPDFDAEQKYPLVLEIHGGPFAAYGPHFAAEIQLYAAAGYAVLYTNPRGSTSYGEEFGNLIHHAYPGHDYDDLMSAVDHVIARGFVDPKRLFVTGGSGGGVLTSWIVGQTERFRAAVVQKPVINWYGFVLTADGVATFAKYWFPGLPWEHAEHYLQRSPIHHVGKVTTPTMLITGEEDLRTPISESEQYYNALKLRRIDTALVRIPGASHGIANRPSQMLAKVAYVLGWFAEHDVE